jgi:hypothetical protein
MTQLTRRGTGAGDVAFGDNRPDTAGILGKGNTTREIARDPKISRADRKLSLLKPLAFNGAFGALPLG